jgi:uncharacterized protein (TIGR02246 family)
MRVGVFVLAFVMGVAGEATAQNLHPDLLARSREFMTAMKAKDAAKVASFYAEDAIAFNEGAPVMKGRAAIQKDIEGMLKLGLADMTSQVIDATVSGNLGYVFGTFAFPASQGGKPRTGHYLEVWKRVGNSWLIAYDTFSADPSPK